MTKTKIRRIIGIDFGTSSSVVCFKDYADGAQNAGEEPKHVYFDFQPLVRTLVYTANDGLKSYGAEAGEKGKKRPENLHVNFKMGLADAASSRSYKESCVLMQDFFRYLYAKYMDQRILPHNADIDESTYVSYPSKWPFETKEVTVDAAKRAGFPNVTGLAEPVAAMQFFFSFQTEQMRNLTRRKVIADGKTVTILLLDMGAGTTDLALYKYVCGRPEGHEVLCTWPPFGHKETFGGHELDRRLATFIKTEFIDKNGIRLQEQRMNWLIDMCKTWKEMDLSPTLANGQAITDEPGFCANFIHTHTLHSPFPKLDRPQFEELAKEYLADFPGMIEGVVGDAVRKGKMAGPEEIDLILLTGGHSRWYFVKEILRGARTRDDHIASRVDIPLIRNEPFRILQDELPELTVARGLALSGQPIRWKQVSTNNIWLLFAIRDTPIAPIKVQESGEILPFKNVIYRQVNLNESSFLDEFKNARGSCLALVGEDLEKAIPMEAVDFVLDCGLIDKLCTYLLFLPLSLLAILSKKYKADLLLKIEVDERERFSVTGLVTFGSHAPGIFVVNREPPLKDEKMALIKEMALIRTSAKPIDTH